MGTMECGDACPDLQTDPDHCGDCDQPCDFGEMCTRGACECADGFTDRDGTCADTNTDPDNCGMCGMQCDGACEDGVCGCAADEMLCDGACTDVTDDDMHCGMCDNACDVKNGEECVDSECMQK